MGSRRLFRRRGQRLIGDTDAHINPAFTVASVLMTGHPGRLLTYIPAQILGAFVGGVLVWLFYLPHWKPTQSAEKKLACFFNRPGNPTPSLQLLERGDRDLHIGAGRKRAGIASFGSGRSYQDWVLYSWARWSGASVCPWAEPRATPSIRHAI